MVKFRDWTMKELLLTMLEWRAVATHEGPVDVWYIGSHMRDWVDERTWRELHDVFGRFDRDDSGRALVATTKLFRRVARETAAALSLDYPDELERQVTDYILGFAG